MMVDRRTHSQVGVQYEVLTAREEDQMKFVVFVTHIDGKPVNQEPVAITIPTEKNAQQPL